MRRRRSRATRADAAGEARASGSLRTTSYSARLPNESKPVAGSHVSETYTRGPITAVMPASPGTLPRVPAMANIFCPRRSESPTLALSATNSDASTSTMDSRWTRDHAVAGTVSMAP